MGGRHLHVSKKPKATTIKMKNVPLGRPFLIIIDGTDVCPT